MLRRVCQTAIRPVIPRRSAGVFVHRDTDETNAEIPFEWTEENLVRIQAIKNQYPLGLTEYFQVNFLGQPKFWAAIVP